MTFGLPRRDVLSDRIKTPTLSQALHLMNGETVQPKIVDPNNILGRMLARGRERYGNRECAVPAGLFAPAFGEGAGRYKSLPGRGDKPRAIAGEPPWKASSGRF